MRRTSNSQSFPVEVVGSSKFGVFSKVNAEKTYNMYISDGWLVNFPGYRRVAEFLPQGEGRALFRSFRANIMIAVINSNVYRVTESLSSTIIGSLDTATGEVYIAENLNGQICIVDGLSMYIYDYTSPPNLTKQTLPDNLVPSYVTYHNTFFLVGNGDKTGLSKDWAVFEPDTSDPTRVTLNTQVPFQVKPDYAVAIVPIPSQANNVLVLGESSCELRTQVGGLENYKRNQTVNIDYGLLSLGTLAWSDKVIMWLGVNESNQPALMLFSGQEAKRISTDGIDKQLAKIKHPEESTAMFARNSGHLQYILTFHHEDDNLTLMFDTETGQFFHLSDGNTDYHPMRQIAYFNNKVYFVSINNGSLYELNDKYTDINENIYDGIHPDNPNLIDEIPFIRIGSTIRMSNTAPFRANSFTITLDMGNDDLPAVQDCLIIMVTESGIPIYSQNEVQVVPENGGTQDCESHEYVGSVKLALSNNGGETYGNYVSRPTNPKGNRRNIIRWEGMGMYNEWTPNIKFCTRGRVVTGSAELEVF